MWFSGNQFKEEAKSNSMRSIILLFLLVPVFSYLGLHFNMIPDARYVVANTSKKSIPLYENVDNSLNVAAILNPGEKAKYLHAGKTGRWIYINIYNRKLAVQSEKITLGYEIKGLPFIDQKRFQYVALSCLIVFIISMFFNSPVRKKRLYDENEREKYAQAKVGEAKKEFTESHRIETDRLKKHYENKNRIVEERIQKELLEKIMSELDIDRAPTIDNMISSVDNLRNIYDEAIANALTFGIDLKHARFENLLKGRLFEICIAKIVNNKLKYTILEWTPDKGFDHDIFVQSNLNPDLIISGNVGNKFAIECKYRSKLNTLAKVDNSVSWAEVKQVERYIDFAKKRNMPVYLALGIEGDPSKPGQIIISPLDSIIDVSKKVDFRNHKEKDNGVIKSPSYVCAFDDLKYWCISADNPKIPWVSS